MIREVDLVSYLPPFMQVYQETVATLQAETPEFLIVWKATDRVLYNHFISTADEYGISRFEKMLGIVATGEDTLEDRRMKVRNHWYNQIPYTMRTLIQKLASILGETYDFSLHIEFYNIFLTIYAFQARVKHEEIEHTLSFMVPMNMVINIIYENPLVGKNYCGVYRMETDILQLKQRRI